MAKDTILVICAHNDDQIIGAGGTLAKYIKEGKRVVVVIFSYGELSHPWLKKDSIQKTRLEECKEADKIIGIKNTVYLGLADPLSKNLRERKVKKDIMEAILKYKPVKIFTHSKDDPHPDHRLVQGIVSKLIDKEHINCEVYTFEVWNPINIRERAQPKLVVDTSNTFKTKIESLKCHKSQRMTILSLLWNVYRKDFLNGLKNHHKFAEIFYKIK